MIKAVFFDIDGTLFSHTMKKVPESSRKAIGILKQKGIKCLIASGRHRAGFRHLIDESLKFDGYVLSNGQLGYDGEERLIFDMPIPEEDLAKILEKFRNQEMAMMLEDENHQFANRIDDLVIRAHENVSTGLPKLGEYPGTKIYQMVAYADPAELERFAKEIPHCRMTYWDPIAVDIIAAEGGKMWGIRQMLKHLGLKPEEVMVFGDGENDVEMIRYAGIGIAMENGEASAKEAADYVTAGVDEDGIWKGLVHYGLIEE